MLLSETLCPSPGCTFPTLALTGFCAGHTPPSGPPQPSNDALLELALRLAGRERFDVRHDRELTPNKPRPPKVAPMAPRSSAKPKVDSRASIRLGGAYRARKRYRRRKFRGEPLDLIGSLVAHLRAEGLPAPRPQVLAMARAGGARFGSRKGATMYAAVNVHEPAKLPPSGARSARCALIAAFLALEQAEGRTEDDTPFVRRAVAMVRAGGFKIDDHLASKALSRFVWDTDRPDRLRANLRQNRGQGALFRAGSPF